MNPLQWWVWSCVLNRHFLETRDDMLMIFARIPNQTLEGYHVWFMRSRITWYSSRSAILGWPNLCRRWHPTSWGNGHPWAPVGTRAVETNVATSIVIDDDAVAGIRIPRSLKQNQGWKLKGWNHNKVGTWNYQTCSGFQCQKSCL